MKRIVIFGATGNTGLAATAAAINKGYEVTAFVRDPQKLPSDLKVASIVQGDVTNPEDVDKAVVNQDGVIIALGTRNILDPTTMMSEGAKNIMTAMMNHNIKRVSCCVSSFLFWDRAKVPERFLPVHEDHERMLQVLKDSDREWVAVCPPHISDDPPRGDYKLELDGPVGRVISKFDLGEILTDSLTTDDRLKHLVGMGYPQ